MITNASISDIQPLIEYLKLVPFNVSRTKLYSASELYEGYCPEEPASFENCFDTSSALMII